MKVLVSLGVDWGESRSEKHLEVFKDHAERSSPDFTVVGGNLIKNAFSNEEEQGLYDQRGNLIKEVVSPEEKFKLYNKYRDYLWSRFNPNYGFFDSHFELMRFLPVYAWMMKHECCPETKEKAHVYLELIRTLAMNVDKQYREIKKIIGTDIKVIPGSNDKFIKKNPIYEGLRIPYRKNEGFDRIFKHLRSNPLSRQNFDMKCKNVKGITVAGVGGANDLSTSIDIINPFMPIELTNYFEEYNSDFLPFLLSPHIFEIYNIMGERMAREMVLERKRRAENKRNSMPLIDDIGDKIHSERIISVSDDLESKLVSKPCDFLKKQGKIDIVIAHSPAQGHLDSFNGRNVGSWGLAEYVQSGLVTVFCAGHTEERGIKEVLIKDKDNQIVEDRQTTIIMNPGRLIDGHFAEIEFDDATKKVSSIKYFSIQPERFLNTVLLDFVYVLDESNNLKCIEAGHIKIKYPSVFSQ